METLDSDRQQYNCYREQCDKFDPQIGNSGRAQVKKKYKAAPPHTIRGHEFAANVYILVIGVYIHFSDASHTISAFECVNQR